VEKYSRAGEATDDDMAHAHFTLGTLSEYVILIAFLPQHLLLYSASMLRYT